MKYINEVFLASVTDKHPSSTVANLAYQAELEINFDSVEVNFSNRWAYTVKFKTYDEDNLPYNMAMTV